ncbi:MAG: hypothetical protein FWF36_01855 [Propionibacteriaceae bacterium]|nr:hypothetical protein [Propionibacteriaceae bacterium]
MAYATAAYGDTVPILAGILAARHWHAIPRAIAVTVIVVPEQHRPVTLATGGRVVFTQRDTIKIDAVPVTVGLGVMRVTGIEQTLVDLITRPDLGGLPAEARAAAASLIAQANTDRLASVVNALPTTTATKVRAWLAEQGNAGVRSQP